MTSSNPAVPDIGKELQSIGETKTAADLVREKGQHRQLKVVSERKLRELMEAIIGQLVRQRDAKVADAFSDQEKEEMLRRAQDELRKRMQQQRESDADRERLMREYEEAQQVLSNAEAGQAETKAALDALRKTLEETQGRCEDLQQRLVERDDELQEKLNLLDATIDEKDLLRTDRDALAAERERLNGTIKAQMLRSNDLVQAALALDAACYGNRHQDDNPPPDDADGDAAFYHDFTVAAKVIADLGTDLQRVRTVADQALAEKDEALAEKDRAAAGPRLLESDLKLLEELKAGSLKAVDVAEPVAGLVEALDGAREAVAELDRTVIGATGAGRQAVLSAVPDAPEAGDDPAPVIAAATAVVRELAKAAVDDKARIEAMAQLSSDADEARNRAEEEADRSRAEAERSRAEAERLRKELDRVIAAVAAKGATPAQGTERVPRDAPIEERSAAALAGLAAAEHERNAIHQAMDRLVDAIAERSRPEAAAALRDQAVPAPERARAAVAALADLRTSADADRQRSQAVAEAVVGAARGDAVLADRVAELALAVDEADSGGEAEQILPAVQALAERKRELEAALAAKTEEAARSGQELSAALERLAGIEARRRTDSEQAAAQNTAVLTRAKAETESMQQQLRQAAAARAKAEADAQVLRGQLAELEAAAAATAADAGKLRGELLDLRQAAEAAAAAAAAAEARRREAEDAAAATGREAARLAAELHAAQAAIAAAEERERAKAGSERALAAQLVEIARGDDRMSAAGVDLANLLEASAGAFDTPQALVEHTLSAVSVLAGRKRELETDAERLAAENAGLAADLAAARERAAAAQAEIDELSASGKEIISQLGAKRDEAARRLVEVQEQLKRSETALKEAAGRVQMAETANRQLAEAMAKLAASEPRDGQPESIPGLEDPRIDLDLALSQLPAEGETGIDIPKDISLQIAESGVRLADALIARRQARTESHRRSVDQIQRVRAEADQVSAELDRARSQLEEREAEARKARAEAEALKLDYAAKEREAADARTDARSVRIELAVANDRLKDNEQRTAEARAREADARRRAEDLADRLTAAENRAAHAEQFQKLTVEAISGLGGGAGDDVLARAAQKLEAARAADPQVLANASQSFAEALRSRLARLGDELRATREDADAIRAQHAAIVDEVAHLRAALVDRDAAIAAGREETARLHAAATAAEQRAQQASGQIADLQGEVGSLSEQVRSMQAELDERSARNATSGEILGGELTRMKDELAAADRSIAGLRDELEEARGRSEAAEAKARRAQEELRRRLEERDKVIAEKDARLAATGSDQADRRAMEAEIAELGRQLRAARDRLAEIESAGGAGAGVQAREHERERELKRLQTEVAELREQRSRLEADLADRASDVEAASAQLRSKLKERDRLLEEAQKRVADALADRTAKNEEIRALKEELVGLKAKVRTLTGSSSGGPGMRKRP